MHRLRSAVRKKMPVAFDVWVIGVHGSVLFPDVDRNQHPVHGVLWEVLPRFEGIISEIRPILTA